jgi:hypothetical protein
MLERVGVDPVTGRTLSVARIGTLDTWPSTIELPPDFVLLLTLDAGDLSDARVGAFATKLVVQGVGYACCWGPDCHRVHRLFDRAAIEANRFVMTTWHEDETLDEALWFAVNVALPPNEPTGPPSVLCAATDDLIDAIHVRLADLPSLTRDVVGED